MKKFSLLLCGLLLVACASCASKEQLYERLYNGVAMRARMDEHPLELATRDQVSYQRYKQEKSTALPQEPPLPADNVQ